MSGTRLIPSRPAAWFPSGQARDLCGAATWLMMTWRPQSCTGICRSYNLLMLTVDTWKEVMLISKKNHIMRLKHQQASGPGLRNLRHDLCKRSSFRNYLTGSERQSTLTSRAGLILARAGIQGDPGPCPRLFPLHHFLPSPQLRLRAAKGKVLGLTVLSWEASQRSGT